MSVADALRSRIKVQNLKTMTKITAFSIKGLHAKKDVDIKFKNNTLILVGENGTGKTTCLHLFYYLITGQWTQLARYRFQELAITINGKKHRLTKKQVTGSMRKMHPDFLRRFPHQVRNQVFNLLETHENPLESAELRHLCDHYGIPSEFIFREMQQFDLFEGDDEKASQTVRDAIKEIETSMNAQILYLPTYRRIEQELHQIFQDLDKDALQRRRRLPGRRKKRRSYLELVEFGMQDVQAALKETQRDLDMFARRNMTDLSYGFLGDIVGKLHETEDLESVRKVDPKTVDAVLNRVQENILPEQRKTELKNVIQRFQKGGEEDEASNVTCYYFAQLLDFHSRIEKREANLKKFCEVCNEYMVDKKYHYDNSEYSAKILPNRPDAGPNDEINLSSLSSGEKQIISLFSHLYLSGETQFFVLIDEPELSLSVPWQRKFLADIRGAGLCTGLFAVTHSPFIYDNELENYAHGMGEFTP